ncbi:transcription termination/antitermination protein NusG [Macadamia integrifolia]|uniref:transcription termination/antitermination protein NusG n=1 Tax=Macadamia integrifolia TaxID=60698 RepID=UPI001C4F57FB|nr:transcription termination/antitermination protein NusG [Macadamia integrifolia]
MKQGLLIWSPCCHHPALSFPQSLSSLPSLRIHRTSHKTVISATTDSVNSEQLTARERRQLRNQRRESNATNWKEEVEERLLKKPKKKHASWKEELNLDNLALLGPQWWVVRVSRVSSEETADRLAETLARNYPDIEFKVYAPATRVKRKLKNGSYSVKHKPLFPGCVFLRCVLNKEIHDFIRECDRVGGFVGSKVGNTKRQINRPRPVSSSDMEAIFRQAKEEQEKADQAFAEEQQEELFNGEVHQEYRDVTGSVKDSKPKRRLRKGMEPIAINPSTGEDKLLSPGASVRVLSGPFAEFTGCLKDMDHKTGKATVGFMLFGKESIVNLDAKEVVAETT